VHERVAVPEPVMLLGVIAPQVRLAGTMSVNATVPEKPFTPVNVIVHVMVDPTGVDDGEQFSDIVKSVTVNVAVVEWDSAPLVPVTVRV